MAQAIVIAASFLIYQYKSLWPGTRKMVPFFELFEID